MTRPVRLPSADSMAEPVAEPVAAPAAAPVGVPPDPPAPMGDFLTAPFAAPVAVDGDLDGPARFFNRELSWIAFNHRVLEEAANPDVPLLERLRFLSISASNLDEFTSVRVAGLRELARNPAAHPSPDGLTPAQALTRIEAGTRTLMAEQTATYLGLKDTLAAQGIRILSRGEIAPEDRAALEETFLARVFPILSPLAIDPAHPFPFIPNGGFALALALERTADRRSLRALLPVPSQIDRFVALPGDGLRVLPLEELILLHLDRLFPGYRVIGSCAFRVLRDSDLDVADEAEDLVREFEVALKRRRRGEVVRLKLTADAPPSLRALVMAELKVEPHEVVEAEGLIGIGALSELVSLAAEGRPDLLWPPFTPRIPERVQDHGGDIFGAIRQKDMLLHHPYESFDMVVGFLQQAARDPDVVAIRQTLYRTSRNSPIVDALCEAAESGKSVTALVELKARFDEAANISQSRRLEGAGAHVVYGFTNLKTHAKMSVVVRREGGGLVTYSHFGTGNYHPITARIYTDLSLFTVDPRLGRDATKVFNYVGGYAVPDGLDNLAIAPLTLRDRLLDLIAAEADHARAGKPAAIWLKLNSITDERLIDALYAASRAGVEISLVVRGICGLRPGVAGLSERIRVKSVVGRFLEHSRIACFGNGHGLPARRARVFLSSADWMGRNMDLRVETLVEAMNPTVKAQILDQIMAANMADTAQSWVLDGHGAFRRANPGERPFSCHRWFMENPSLSGRGRKGARDVHPLTDPQLPD